MGILLRSLAEPGVCGVRPHHLQRRIGWTESLRIGATSGHRTPDTGHRAPEAVGPGGVVALESKNHARLDRITPRMYAQARGNAARVTRATGREAHAVLVLTRARVHRKDRRNDEGVTVLTLDRLNRHLRRMSPVLSAGEFDVTVIPRMDQRGPS